jgi:hypothetical protein
MGETDPAALPENPEDGAVKVDVAAGLVAAGQHENADLRWTSPGVEVCAGALGTSVSDRVAIIHFPPA